MRWTLLIAVSTALAVACNPGDARQPLVESPGRVSPASEPSLTLRLLDVSSSPVGGLAVLVADSTGDRARYILIDGGEYERAVVRQLRGLGVDSLTLVVLTHPHTDHYGGLAAVIREIPVQTFAWNGDTRTLGSFLSLLRAVERSAATPVIVDSADRRIAIASGRDTLDVRLLAPLDARQARRARGDPINNRSVGVLFRYGRFSALVPGDAEHAQLANWMDRLGQELDVDVLVASHHGARDANSTARRPRWYRTVTPRALLIGANGRQHPFAEVLDHARAEGIPVYCTHTGGAVTVTARRTGEFAVRTERQGACAPGSEQTR